VAERESETIGRLLASGRAAWEPFVRRDWVARGWAGKRIAEIDEVVLWLCVCLGRWLDK
jgi:hypothetical protein